MSGREYKIFLFLLNVKRTLEPEIMNDNEQAKAYAEADFSSTDEEMVIQLERNISRLGSVINNKSLIVDIGCGPGNITERLASKWPFAKVIGIDGSAEMLDIARQRKEKNQILRELKGLSYLEKNLASFLEERFKLCQSADLVVSNSVLHHFHDPSLFWKVIKNIGKKGTIIFHKDLRRPRSSDEAKSLLRKYQSESPSILKRDYLASLQAAFTFKEVEAQLNSAGLCQLKVFAVDDRYLEIIGVL